MRRRQLAASKHTTILTATTTGTTTTNRRPPQVEDLFSTGDLPRVAELLRSMGRSLALVGDVPEFRWVGVGWFRLGFG
jgi:hypothetical protein